MRSKINSTNVLGFISFLSLLLALGAVESEMYVVAFILIAVMGITAYLAMREEKVNEK